MSAHDRSWMYNRRLPNREGITDEFRRGLKSFIDFALANPRYMNGEKIRCPCVKCHNRNFHHVIVTQRHLLTHGFTHGYNRWIAHGEKIQVRPNVGSSGSQMNRAPVIEPDAEVIPENMIIDEEPFQCMENMVRDAAGPEFDWSENARQEPNPVAKKFIDVWAMYMVYWNSPEAKAASERARKNKASGSGSGTKHTTGSINIAEHQARMMETYGPHIEYPDVFVSTHTRVTGPNEPIQWVDEKAEAVYNEYKEKVRTESSSSNIVWSPPVWCDVASKGRKKKGGEDIWVGRP